MVKSNNIYNYKIPKSGYDETHYFLTKGRITRKAFFLRLLLVAFLLIVSNLVLENYAKPQYIYWAKQGNGLVRNTTFLMTYNIFKGFNDIYFPIALCIFLFVQGIKRMHDVNKSGWYLFIPFYNLVLLLSSGTVGNNDYGIDPKPQRIAKYFDELESKK